MLKDNKPIVNTPNPSHKKGSIIDKLIEFLEETLLIFQKENKGEIDTPEKGLNQKLSLTLEKQSRVEETEFVFQQETIQKQAKGHSRSVDLGVFSLYGDLITPIYTIEAKRLTTTSPNDRKKEYILGKDKDKLTGGIERFKYNLHGVNLNKSSIVGYVQREDNNYWFAKINNWIQELFDNTFWKKGDLLKNTCGFADVRLAKFISINGRDDNSIITLTHYFVNLNE